MSVDESWQARVCICVPQLSLPGQTSSEGCMRVDESLSSFFDFFVFARCFPASLSSFFDACQTGDSPSHYFNCHLSIIRNNIFFFSSSDLEIACFCNSLRLSCNSHDRSNEPNLSAKLMRVIKVGGQMRARIATRHAIVKIE